MSYSGVVDANVARNNIAKDYMKKCDCIWILAPITRAVDDKTARGTSFISSCVYYSLTFFRARFIGGRVQNAIDE